jgi:hypothetical protein
MQQGFNTSHAGNVVKLPAQGRFGKPTGQKKHFWPAQLESTFRHICPPDFFLSTMTNYFNIIEQPRH